MICQRTQFGSGALKVLGLASVSDADLAAAEREVYYEVLGGVTYESLDTAGPSTAKAKVADLLAPFVFVQLAQDRNQYARMQGEVTDVATAYGRTATSVLLRTWNRGVTDAVRIFDDNDIRQTWPTLRFIGRFKI